MENLTLDISSNRIHPTAIIGKEVVLGQNNFIGPYCIIEGKTTIGNNNIFKSHCSIGLEAQHKLFKQVPFGVCIGDNNVFREFTTVHAGTKNDTIIKNGGYFMNYVHIPHDCEVGNDVTIANNTQIAGHVIISDNCNIGLSCVIHQFSILGEGCMIGMGTIVPKNKRITPYKTFVGNPCRELKDNDYLIEKLGLLNLAVLEKRKQYNTFFNERFLK